MKSSPPPFLLRFFRWFCRPELHVYIEGDLIELYEERKSEFGKTKANLRFALDILLLFRPAIIKPLTIVNFSNNNFMIDNYFKIAYRNLVRKKMYSFINILGLAIGMACCMLIFQYVFFELNFDKFHANNGSIFRINQVSVSPDNEASENGNTGWAPGPIMAESVPEIINFVRLHPEYDNAIVSNPSKPDLAFEETQLFYADSTFFDVFSFPLAEGHAASLLQPGTLVLTETLARKYFGDEDPMDKLLDVRGWIQGTYRITGILKDIPANSQLQFTMLLPIADLLVKSEFRNEDTGWGWSNFLTYVRLQSDADVDHINDLMTDIYMENREEDFKPTNRRGGLRLQAMTDIHLDDKVPAPFTKTSSKKSVYFFSIVGLVTLLIAFINYINLTTARALDRAREVGVRKVIGARRRQLILQFLTESIFTITLSFLLALLLAYIISPVISGWTSIPLTDILWSSPLFWLSFASVLCLFTIIAGLYPALILSSFQPKQVLKGRGRYSGMSRYLRQGLVILQFSISIALLAGTLVVQNQMNFLKNMDIGLGLDQIVTILGPRVLPEDQSQKDAHDRLQRIFQQIPGVLNTTSSQSVPGRGHSFTTSNIRRAEADRSGEIEGAVTFVDSAFATVYDLELLAGDGFKNISLPLAEEEKKAILANEEGIRALGFENPEEAIGHALVIGGNDCIVKGVVKNFNWNSAHATFEPTYLWLVQNNHLISAKIPAANLQETLPRMEASFKELFPGNPFVYSFADETFEAQYRNDQRFSRLFNMFAGFAVFIACLGLFGLATHTAQQRQKEVGIRKVMGANVMSIVLLLSRDFMKLVLTGFVLAIPITLYVMNQWLDGFAFKTNIGFSVFLFSGTAAVIIAIMTVCWQSVHAALTNPVDSLKDE